MLSCIQRTIADHDLVAPGDRVLVAVSGGPDSTALLFGLSRLAARLRIDLRAAVVDHGLRPESAAEAAAVARTCAGLGIACEVLPVTVRRRAHVSIQDAARRARAVALTEAAERSGCQRVALGHTADDQAETVLFRIVRGTGLAGLAGIPYRRDRLIRPLLDVRRAEVLRFLRRRGIPFVEDPSNRDPRFARSRVRAEWLPFLARENPRIVEALLALAADSRAQRSRLQASPIAWGAESAHGPGRAAATRIRQLARRAAGTKWISFRGGTAEVAYGQVTLAPEAPPAAAGPPAESLSLPGPGCYRWQSAGGVWNVEVTVARGRFHAERAAAVGQFSKDCLSSGLVLRAWRAGDRMRPRGAPGARKLQDLFVDAKVPRVRRRQLPVLVTGDGTILYVPGLRPADRARPLPDAREWVEVRVTGPVAHLSCPKTDSASARVDDLSLDDNTFSLGGGYTPSNT
jgi:tRNA(Ile)-lysidine synthase